jgi:hypothetical protein
VARVAAETTLTDETQPKRKRRERRRSRRFRASVRCWITGRRSALYTPLRNISRGGIAVGGLTPFEEGEEISIRIQGAHRSTLEARSRVIWTRGHDDPEPTGMGAEFVEITAGEQVLDRLLAEEKS